MTRSTQAAVSNGLLSRRCFLAAAAACAVAPTFAGEQGGEAPAALSPGVQLGSVQAALARDFAGTLAKLADMGYRRVELGDLHGKSAAEWKKALAGAGLTAASAHYDVHTLQYDFDRSFDFAREIGLSYMVVAAPRASDGVCPTFEEWRWNAAFLNTIGSLTAKAGIRLGYHNHDIEFTRYPAGKGRYRTAFDELIDGTDPARVTFQLDCGWAAAAGQAPADLLARYPGRITLLHVRDVQKGLKPNRVTQLRTTVVGQGALDWKAILTAARAAGVRDSFVALGPTPGESLDLLQQSATYLSSL